MLDRSWFRPRQRQTQFKADPSTIDTFSNSLLCGPDAIRLAPIRVEPIHWVMEPSTLLEVAHFIAQGGSSLELVNRALELADEKSDLNVFAYLDTNGAREAASNLDLEAQTGKLRGPLHGVPITIKDLYNVAGMPTRAGTRAALPEAFQNPSQDALAVSRLRAAGAVILGKVNMHEIALGITGENSWTGDVKNPRDPSRQAGGSSSGSASSVAAGIGFASLGSDTGGSIRIPASFCGCVGFKPSFGLVPLEGALHLSMTCDHAGPLTRTVADAHIMLEALSAQNLLLRKLESVHGRKFGVPRSWLEGRLGVEVRAGFEALLERLRVAGAGVIDVQPRSLELVNAAYSPLVRAEAAFVHRQSLKSAPQGFSMVVRAPLELGLKIGAGEYLEALEFRRAVISGLEDVLSECDALLLPTAPLPASQRGTSTVMLESGPQTHRNAYIELTAPFSLAGLPTLSLPFMLENQMPVGLQVVGATGADARVLELGVWLEAWLSG
jgi:aspartyl-tRNA(Asn)/glutamyl-tRNA(Gln) amidotransferase subunit A